MKMFFLIALLGAFSACGGRGVNLPPRNGELDRSSLRIWVENQHFNDATIYAVRGGSRIRLGSVTGKRSASFTFRWPSDRLRLQVHFIGGRTFLSDQVFVEPGVDDNLQLTIGSGSHSRLYIGRRGEIP